MELQTSKQREWQSKCMVVKGTMEEIAEKINEINSSDDSFVVATHQPQQVAIREGVANVYETLIFYKEKIIGGDNHEKTKRGIQ